MKIKTLRNGLIACAVAALTLTAFSSYRAGLMLSRHEWALMVMWLGITAYNAYTVIRAVSFIRDAD